MSTKIKNGVYRASSRDEISANIEIMSFSTATGVLHSEPFGYECNQAWLTVEQWLRGGERWQLSS